jgi:hypothetical protein
MPKGEAAAAAVSMFFCQSDIEKNFQDKDKDDKSTQYIIYQNNVLQTKYVNLLKEFIELTAEKDLLEDDNDKLQKSKTCLQGHVKNEYIRATNYKMIIKQKAECLSAFIILLFAYNVIATMYMIIPLLTTDRTYIVASIITIMVFQVVCLYYGMVYFKRINNQAVKKLTTENKEIEKSNKYLEELVDNF